VQYWRPDIWLGLLLQVSNPRQEDIESLVKLLRTIGGTLEDFGVRTLPSVLWPAHRAPPAANMSCVYRVKDVQKCLWWCAMATTSHLPQVHCTC
jgi:hypothetical protein